MRNEQRKRLIDILSVQSKSGQTSRMRAHLKKEFEDAGAVVQVIAKQLHVTKGDCGGDPVPLYVAHCDTVHALRPDDQYEVRMFTKDGDIRYVAWDPVERRQVGVGGDDKVGCWVALEAIYAFDNVAAIITIDEEVGCQGARLIRKEHTAHAAILIQADRRGRDDAVRAQYSATISSKAWQTHVEKIIQNYGYDWSNHGAPTDVIAIVTNRGTEVSAVNLSAGYHDPHGSTEWISEWDAENCMELALALGEASKGTRWLHEPERPTYATTSYYTTRNYDNHKKGGQWHSELACSIYPDGTYGFNTGFYYTYYTPEEFAEIGGGDAERWKYYVAQCKAAYDAAIEVHIVKTAGIDVGDDYPKFPKKRDSLCAAVGCEEAAAVLALKDGAWFCERCFERYDRLLELMHHRVAYGVLTATGEGDVTDEMLAAARAFLGGGKEETDDPLALPAAV